MGAGQRLVVFEKLLAPVSEPCSGQRADHLSAKGEQVLREEGLLSREPLVEAQEDRCRATTSVQSIGLPSTPGSCGAMTLRVLHRPLRGIAENP